MTLQEIYALLEKKDADGKPLIENGPEMATALKAEFKARNDEAAGYRTKAKTEGEKVRELETRYKKIAETLELKDDDDLDGALSDLNALRKSGTKPSDVSKFENQLKKLEAKLKESEEKAQASEAKRIQQLKINKAMAALKDTVKPEEISKLILEKIVVTDDEKIIFKNGDEELPFDEGVKSWLDANPWAVRNNTPPGAGSSSGSGNAEPNPYSKKSFNLTQQMILEKKEPEKAAKLASIAKNEKQ